VVSDDAKGPRFRLVGGGGGERCSDAVGLKGADTNAIRISVIPSES
jgi:hypothetical protein